MCELTKAEFDELKKLVERNDRTLRGNDGNRGLCTIVELIQVDIKWIRETLEKESKGTITWKWIVDKLAAPVVTAIIVGAILLLLG